GSTLEIVLFGSSADHVAAEKNNFESNNSPVLVDICCALVKIYRGKVTLLSTNGTKVYTNTAIPSMVELCTSHPCAGLPQRITLPYNERLTEIPFPAKPTRKKISQLIAGGWDPSFQWC
ncbi:hypothetical protein MKX01_001306, partial [Papaver californicum]